MLSQDQIENSYVKKSKNISLTKSVLKKPNLAEQFSNEYGMKKNSVLLFDDPLPEENTLPNKNSVLLYDTALEPDSKCLATDASVIKTEVSVLKNENVKAPLKIHSSQINQLKIVNPYKEKNTKSHRNTSI